MKRNIRTRSNSTLSYSIFSLIFIAGMFISPAYAVKKVPSEYTTIQDAVDAANNDEVIELSGTLTGDGNYNVEIDGKSIIIKGDPETIVDCENKGRGFSLINRANTTLMGFTIQNAAGTFLLGGGVYAHNSSIIIDGVNFIGCTASTGGAIYCGGSSAPIIRNCTITGCSAKWGAGIAVEVSGYPTIYHNTITNGTNCSRGGAIWCGSTSPTIDGNTIRQNTANSGGGIYTTYCTSVKIKNNTFEENAAVIPSAMGGAISTYNSTGSISHNTITGNTSQQSAAGINIASSSNITIHNNLIQQNIAGFGGGGISASTSSVTIKDNTITENSAGAGNGGGGIQILPCTYIDINGNAITNNTLDTAGNGGGGLYLNTAATVYIWNNAITGNTVTGGNGGGIWFMMNSHATNTKMWIWKNIISGNQATWQDVGIDDIGHGGGFYFTLSNPLSTKSPDPDFWNNIVDQNTADRNGGGGYLENIAGEYTYNTFTRNTADNSGSGGYNGGGLYCTGARTATSPFTIPHLESNILWDDSPEEICTTQAGNTNGLDILYSDVQGGQAAICGGGLVNWDPASNIDLDPNFVDVDDYHLDTGSQCMNRANPLLASPTDIENTPRPLPAGSNPDMGAYEAGPNPFLVWNTTFRPSLDGYQFPNYSLIPITWDLFADTFGREKTELPDGSPRMKAQTFYRDYIKFVADGGSCYGMSASSSLLHANNQDTWNLGDDRSDLLDPYRGWELFEDYMATVEDFIESYHIRQMSRQAVMAEMALPGNAVTTYYDIQAHMAGGNWTDDPYVLGFYWGTGGHAVVPYKIEQAADGSYARMYVYDPNLPYSPAWESLPSGQDRYFFEFDLTANRWRYAQIGATANWQIIPPGVAMPRQIVYARLSDITGELSILGETDTAMPPKVMSDPSIAGFRSVTGSGHLLCTDDQNRSLGYEDGEFVSEIPDAMKIMPYLQAGEEFPETYFLSGDAGSYTINLIGTEAGTAVVDMFGETGVVRLLGVSVTGSTEDEITVGSDENTVTYSTDDAAKDYAMRIIKELTNSSRVFTIAETSLGSGEVVTFQTNADQTELEYVNPGGAKTYDLLLHEYGENAGSFTSEDIAIGANESHAIQVDDWNDIENTGIRILVDEGNDGSIDRQIELAALEINIQMGLNWNLISIPVNLANTAMADVLQTIDGLYTDVWGYDAATGEWERYVEGAPEFLNTLTDVVPSKGYWVKMSDEGILALSGSPVEDPIPLLENWNLVGYNSLSEMNVEDALTSIDGFCNAVWRYEASSGEWKKFIEGVPEFLNDLETFQPGWGYWIDADAGCPSWDVNGGSVAAPSSLPVVTRIKNNSPDRPGIPYTIWGNIEANGAKIDNGATVLLKSGDKTLSSYQLGTRAGYGGFYVLDILADADILKSAKLYIQIADVVAEISALPPGNPGQIVRFDLSTTLTPKANILHQNYPNPFNPDTWIPYQLSEDTQVEIGIYTFAGQLVRTLKLGHKEAGFYVGKEKAAHWDGRNEAGESVASGVYFYYISAGEFKSTRKMIVGR